MMYKNVKSLYTIIVLIWFSVNLFGQNYQLAWSDEFTSPQIDQTTWTFETGGNGWGNEELQFYTARDTNAFIQDGKLIIQALKENYSGKNYTSARLITKDKKSFKYGKIEARIKLPYGQGLWPAFWMLGQNYNSVGWPACGEIDIMELIGGAVNRDNTVYGTLHWDNNGQYASYGGSNKLSSGIFADDFHLFTIEWTPKLIKWFVDNKQYHVTDISPSGLSEFQQQYFIILNVAVGGTWPGSPDNTTVFPQRMEIDYVRVFQDASDFPKINITEPINNSAYNEFDDIIINAEIDFTGSVDKVEFFQGNLQIGETSLEPYSMVWRNISAGNYKINAVVQSSDGYSVESEVVNVTVGNGNQKSPYSGTPIKIPGIIEAEDFNMGGNSIAYLDNSQGNLGLSYRNDEDVDIQICLDDKNGFNIGWTEPGEWILYTIDVAKSAQYELTTRVSTDIAGSSFQIEIDDVAATEIISVPNSGDWQTWISVTANINLTQGIHEFKFNVKSGEFNINWFEIYEPDTQPQISLISPIGGELFTIGSIQEIRWNQLKVENVSLGLSIDGGNNWSFITKDLPSKYGSYRWMVPDSPSDNCVIMIIDSKSSSINYMNDSNFIIDYATSVEKSDIISDSFELSQNYPNPFNPTTLINFYIHEKGNVLLRLHDLLGKEIEILIDEYKTPGSYQYILDGSKLSNGVYFYSLQSGGFSATKKLVLLK